MRRAQVVACLAACLGLLAGACAKRVVPPIPEGESYLFPEPTGGDVSRDEAKALREAWNEILAGDAAAGARRCELLLARRPGLRPAETMLGYARLRGGRTEEAAALFAAVLEKDPQDVPALVGAASAELRRGDPERALGFFRRAQAVAPQDALVVGVDLRRYLEQDAEKPESCSSPAADLAALASSPEEKITRLRGSVADR